jgi:hypothetical protein
MAVYHSMRRNATLSVNLADGREFSVNLFVDGVGQRLRAGKIGPWRFHFFFIRQAPHFLALLKPHQNA